MSTRNTYGPGRPPGGLGLAFACALVVGNCLSACQAGPGKGPQSSASLGTAPAEQGPPRSTEQTAPAAEDAVFTGPEIGPWPFEVALEDLEHRAVALSQDEIRGASEMVGEAWRTAVAPPGERGPRDLVHRVDAQGQASILGHGPEADGAEILTISSKGARVGHWLWRAAGRHPEGVGAMTDDDEPVFVSRGDSGEVDLVRVDKRPRIRWATHLDIDTARTSEARVAWAGEVGYVVGPKKGAAHPADSVLYQVDSAGHIKWQTDLPLLVEQLSAGSSGVVLTHRQPTQILVEIISPTGKRVIRYTYATDHDAAARASIAAATDVPVPTELAVGVAQRAILGIAWRPSSESWWKDSVFVASFDQQGVPRWVRQLPAPRRPTLGLRVSVDDDGSLLVSGVTSGLSPNDDPDRLGPLLLFEFGPDGSLKKTAATVLHPSCTRLNFGPSSLVRRGRFVDVTLQCPSGTAGAPASGDRSGDAELVRFER